MDRKPLIGKWFAIGTILLFVGANIAVADNSVQKQAILTAGTPGIEHIPTDGLYWNDRMIAEYHVPLYLHYYFKFRAVFHPQFIITGNSSSEIYMIEYYLDGSLIAAVTLPPWEFELTVTIRSFHHSHTFGIKVFYGEGQIISDNITIYRLFP